MGVATVKLGPYELGPTDDEHQGIYTGDARELAQAIPDESVDLIFTDPVYDRTDDYRWLAETAARVLKPGGALWVCFGIGYQPETMAALSVLCYRWTFVVYKPNAPSTRGAYRVFSKWWGIYWYDKNGMSQPAKHLPDVLASNGASSVRWADTFKANPHVWVKNPEPIISWIHAFSGDDAIVVDFFTGGGTVPAVCKMLGRHWLAFEIDAATADTARERVRNTQPPLFVPEPQQLELVGVGE